MAKTKQKQQLKKQPSGRRTSKIAQELKRIARKNGGILMPEDVVKEAEDEENPLHKSFEWDNTEAAHQWRLQQARSLIRVAVDYFPAENKHEKIFVSLSTDREKEGGYRVLVDVMKNKSQRETLLEDAKKDMLTFQEKYESLEELSKVFKEMKAFTSDE